MPDTCGEPDRSSMPCVGADAEPDARRFSILHNLHKMKRSPGKVEPRTRRRLFWRGLLWLESILAVACIGFNFWASLQLNRELGAVRQHGEPLTLAELSPPPVPDTQNAAKFYQRAHAALPPTVLRLLQRNDPRHANLNRQQLATCHRAIALIRQAAAMPKCSFPNDSQTPFSDAPPQLSMLRQLSRLMRQEALQEALEGQTGLALADIGVVFRISHHLASEPNYIGWLTAITVAHTGYRTLDEILLQSRLTPTQGCAVLQELPGTDWSQALHRAMLGERMRGLGMFETIHAYPMWKLDKIQYLRLMQRIITYARQPPFEAQTTASIKAEAGATPFYAIISSGMASMYDGMLVNRDRGFVLSQLAEVAVALNVYRTAKGHYPTTLKDAEATWGQPLPLDPYSHQPFIYHLQGAKFSLYSVGPNGKDDGGLGNGMSNGGDDIRLTPLRPPLQRSQRIRKR